MSKVIERANELFELGMMYNGEAYVGNEKLTNGFYVPNIDIQTHNDVKWAAMIVKLKAELERRVNDAKTDKKEGEGKEVNKLEQVTSMAIDKEINRMANNTDEQGHKIKAILDEYFYGHVVDLVKRFPYGHKEFLLKALGIVENFDPQTQQYCYYLAPKKEVK